MTDPFLFGFPLKPSTPQPTCVSRERCTNKDRGILSARFRRWLKEQKNYEKILLLGSSDRLGIVNTHSEPASDSWNALPGFRTRELCALMLRKSWLCGGSSKMRDQRHDVTFTVNNHDDLYLLERRRRFVNRNRSHPSSRSPKWIPCADEESSARFHAAHPPHC